MSKDYIFSEMVGLKFNVLWKLSIPDAEIKESINAVFDTGCATTMISFNLLVKKKEISDEERHQLKYKAIMDSKIKKALGFGIESNSKKVKQQATAIQTIIDKCNSNPNSLTQSEMNILLKYPRIRFIYKAKDMSIAGYEIGSYPVSISYDYDNVALIGMLIIKDLYAIIGTKGNHTLLFAKLKYLNGLQTLFEEAEEAFNKIEDDSDQYVDFCDSADFQILEANYLRNKYNL